MSIGIIAEYNPFHNGHIHQLKEAKRRWPNDKITIIMSGKYVQRGELAIASFSDRMEMALKHGADKVVELPFEYATQAAHIFAYGAVMIASELKIDKLFFGSESNDPKRLMTIAKAIKDNEEKYNVILKQFLKMGYSFPKAAAQSLTKLIGNPISLPNDILGLEYCKVIVNNDLPITPHTIKRTVDFHSDVPNMEFASASYIRKQIFMGRDISKYTPVKFKKIPERIEDHYKKFQKIILETPAKKLAKNKMISEGMENLFKKHIDARTFDDFIDRTNSRRYTSSRIKRVMLYVLLGIEK
ncbi:nucleotidyltransferase [Candidatus Mycoplasma mahonii]|uniref:nucleotidyltransferase n=1 Tax=Candidatus Mycoplasma mahonii TaxID=3004105 RepID=UPI0026EFC00A|nr:nucleotidyltransferase [Candidatus Mycoplasma mahonii]WKX02737.1 nucleotidyltransferase [Candidatus Mycoplasma mahonii]